MQARIKAIRKESKMTQAEFAEFLGVSTVNISSYESGRRNPSDAFIQLVCSKCGINQEWLKSGVGEMHSLQESDAGKIVSEIMGRENPLYDLIKHIVETYSELDPKSQQVINNYIDQLMEKEKGRD